jgi:hypothetical protein
MVTYFESQHGSSPRVIKIFLIEFLGLAFRMLKMSSLTRGEEERLSKKYIKIWNYNWIKKIGYSWKS